LSTPPAATQLGLLGLVADWLEKIVSRCCGGSEVEKGSWEKSV
jgi:hypothetical protein